jgi:hypothetical protein
METKCCVRKARFAYPRHRFSPEDLLNFIESREYTKQWSALGLDDENDEWSLELCMMVQPHGDEEIEGTGGLRRHRHFFDDPHKVECVTVYYAYFEDYGVIYLSCLDEQGETVTFSLEERAAIRMELGRVFAELDRLKTIRVSGKSATGSEHEQAV